MNFVLCENCEECFRCEESASRDGCELGINNNKEEERQSSLEASRGRIRAYV